MAKMKEASNKITMYVAANFGKNLKAGTKEWEYDLATKKWISRK